MNKTRTIIIEDDISAQKYLTTILNTYFKTIEIAGYARSIEESVNLINERKPELVFMDIELTDGNAFEIFERINSQDFEVIFVTGFDNFIQKAIEHYAFSFIIKPIDEKQITSVIRRYLNLKERLFTINKLHILTNFIYDTNPFLLLHTGNEHVSVEINNIIKCVADGNYTNFHLTSNKKYLASKSLKYYEKLLVSKHFFKASRSVLINTSFIESIYKKEAIILKNNEKITVSVRNRQNLAVLINLLS